MRTYRPEVNGAPVTIGVERAYLKYHSVTPQLALEGEVLGVSRDRGDGRAVFLPAALLRVLREAGAVPQHDPLGRRFWAFPPAPGRPRWWRVQLVRPEGAHRLTVTLEPATS